MANSQVQQATSQSTQEQGAAAPGLQKLAGFIHTLRSSLSEADLAYNARAEAEFGIATMEAQPASPKPKTVITQNASRRSEMCWKAVSKIEDSEAFGCQVKEASHAEPYLIAVRMRKLLERIPDRLA